MERLQILAKSMETKKEIRKRIRELRANLSIEQIESRSKIITDKILKHPEFQKAELVLCYIDAKGEVQTEEIIRKSWKMCKKVAVPKVQEKEMEFFEITSFEDLEPGNFGIKEPIEGCMKADIQNSRTVVIMPGVAFDMEGNRIGYGGGYYDRYFQHKQDIFRIAPAYEMQIVNKITADEFDIKVDCVLTDM